MNNLPFKEKILEENNKYISVEREFKKDLDSEELVWHRDKEDREVTLKEGSGWYLQLDNELPTLMIEKCKYNIPKETWHRIINKNNTKLIIEVRKYK
tara:strand:- start:766 stop:1056 length:291 start_codon:yes stop_codon:yes gene_type:complete